MLSLSHEASRGKIILSMSQMPECWRISIRLCYKTFSINVTGEQKQKTRSGQCLGFDATGCSCCWWLSWRPCYNTLHIPTNYLTQGATGSHFNLWCLLQWDIAGFKTVNKGGTALKKMCIHSKHESTSNQPTEGNKKVFQRNVFILTIVSSCKHLPSRCMEQFSKKEQ